MNGCPAAISDGDVPAGSRLALPRPPASERDPVKSWREQVVLDTYLPLQADRNPMFLEKRVYQGSSGRVYPLPWIDRIASAPVATQWDAIHLENEWIRVMILPEIGGRIHIGLDKRNGYDFFYRQDVIKPALVGLGGPWISGGVEFNWPQHHRPATFLPVETEIEREPDGAVTVWCSDHDPLQHMKGMHGVRLRPGHSMIELRVRLYNRTGVTQTFLWWANVAAHVHERYQSFFPPDVRYVADHAKRAVTTFPLSERTYYGIDYPDRAARGVSERERPPCFAPDGSYAANDLSWYANIPVPTSYMVTGTDFDFFGGYDHAADAGFVHVANRHIAPGKKQWTWGNHDFGYAWDRSLTDSGGPYIELMAGVYTDNQPDFSYLAPGETKTFSQRWYPLQGLGVPQAANRDAALHCHVEGGMLVVRLAATRKLEEATLEVAQNGRRLFHEAALSLDPSALLVRTIDNIQGLEGLDVALLDRQGEIIRYAPAQQAKHGEPQAATEPLPPGTVATVEQLYLTGAHLELYRHATRSPEDYWLEALRRDEGDARSNTALGRRRLQQGDLQEAARHFRRAIERLTERHPNPADGEPFYYLGFAQRALGEEETAYASFYKATWVAAWRAPGYFALAEMDAKKGRWESARYHLLQALRAESEHNQAIALLVVSLRQLGEEAKAEIHLADALARDPLDGWLRYLSSGAIPAASEAAIDLGLDMTRSGLHRDAERVLESIREKKDEGSRTMALYLLAWIRDAEEDAESAGAIGQRAAASPADYVFPSRLEEMLALRAAERRNPDDARAPYYLGNYLYNQRRYAEATAAWERATQLGPLFPTAWRNLGIARYNMQRDVPGALHAYERAFAANTGDARVLYERDQLWKRAGVLPEVRLRELDLYPELTATRDDLSIERATLLNQTGGANKALKMLLSRHFQPWEGGEGLVLGQYVRSHLLLGRQRLQEGHPTAAVDHFESALRPPPNLSEAWHLLSNRSQVFYWVGEARAACGEADLSKDALRQAAEQRGDFQQMSVQPVSEMTYWSAMAFRALGDDAAAGRLLQQIADYAGQLASEPARIDYFATSLPAMLLFEEDLDKKRVTQTTYLKAQALLGLGELEHAEVLIGEVLANDRNHMDAAEMLIELRRRAEGC